MNSEVLHAVDPDVYRLYSPCGAKPCTKAQISAAAETLGLPTTVQMVNCLARQRENLNATHVDTGCGVDRLAALLLKQGQDTAAKAKAAAAIISAAAETADWRRAGLLLTTALLFASACVALMQKFCRRY